MLHTARPIEETTCLVETWAWQNWVEVGVPKFNGGTGGKGETGGTRGVEGRGTAEDLEV